MSQLIPPMELLDCEGEPASVGLRLEKWKRALGLYLTATNVTKSEAKRALLLHMGGLSQQEIYYNIPGAHVETAEVDVDVFTVAVSKLDEYFSPKQSRVYERHLFRLVKQEIGEKFDKFLIRLRQQCFKCKFTAPEEHIIDQITEKCESAELRKKILTLGDEATLDKIVFEANALETVHRQLHNFNSLEPMKEWSVNRVETNKKKSNSVLCSRCGGSHSSDWKACPANDKKCLKFGFIGHYRNCCRTRADKRKSDVPYKTGAASKKSKTKPEKVDYIFHLDGDDSITFTLSGVAVDMLIDSGSKCNIINDATWEILKTGAVRVENQVKNPDKTFMAYGSQNPLKVLGSFDSCIRAENGFKVENATFYIVKDGNRNLLGKETATKLGVLRVGYGVNEIDEIDLETKDRDTEMKAKGKEYADRKRRATECTIEIGEKVYVKNMTKENKLSPTFNDAPHTVIISKKGNDVELESDNNGQRLRRNIVHLKRIEGQWNVFTDKDNSADTTDNNVIAE